MKRNGRAFLIVMVLLGVCAPWSYGQRLTRASAWERLLRADPSAADNPSIGWRERLILYALTPEQAGAYFSQAAEPSDLLLEDGRTLEEYLSTKLSPPASFYVGLPVPCALFSSDVVESGATYALQVRGSDLGRQGGSTYGCEIPAEATAVILQLRMEPLEPCVRLKLWPADGPEPVESVLAAERGNAEWQSTVVATLATASNTENELLLRATGSTTLSAEVVGYFRAMRAGNGPFGNVSFYTEGDQNNFFGGNAGISNTGSHNSFFGGNAGMSNSSGSENSFFGSGAGYSNTSGSSNSFFGTVAGFSNTTGYANAFFGGAAGQSNTTGHFNAFFGVGSGNQNTTGYENSAFGQGALEE
ncbi:MAG: hypothetical protein WAO20_15155, partial [Acidobacteriota bacterium]